MGSSGRTVDTSTDMAGDTVSVDLETPKKPHKMASTFELGDEQPETVVIQPRKAKEDSFNNLFGPPTEARKKKPLPLNPVTGELLGSGQDKVVVVKNAKTAQAAKPGTRRPPGDHHSQLW